VSFNYRTNTIVTDKKLTMPYIQVTASEGLLNKHDQDTIIKCFSHAVLHAAGASVNDPAALSVTWAYYQEQPRQNFSSELVQNFSEELKVFKSSMEYKNIYEKHFIK